MDDIKNYGIVGYVPDYPYGTPRSFLSNIRKYKTQYPLTLLSHNKYDGVDYRCDKADHARTPTSFHFTPHNYAFLQCARAAKEMGWSHFMIVEDDCRVNCDNWDAVIYDQFQPQKHMVMGRHVAWIHQTQTGNDAEYFADWYLHAARDLSVGDHPLPVHLGIRIEGNGWDHPNSIGKTMVHPNGAFAVMNTDLVSSMYDLDGDLMTQARCGFAWDMYIGIWMRKYFGVDAFSKMGTVKRVYSGYKDFIDNEVQRKEWLQEKRWGLVAIHQIKTQWEPT